MSFSEHLHHPETSWTDSMQVLQVNVGKLCNMACHHCHVEAGPSRTESMSRQVMEACLAAYQLNGFQTIDITGGAPEMNPDFEWFLEESCKISDHVIVRTNLTVLQLEGYHHLEQVYADNKIEIDASLPCYTKENTDAQRGSGAYEASVKTIRELNALGYGTDPELILNFVYNPGGAFLPPSQEELEKDYKTILADKYGIVFNQLLTITNNPIGRFKRELVRSGEYDSYDELLKEHYNPETEQSMMCRFQVSVGYDGRLYDCDFNQALDLPINGAHMIFDIAEKPLKKRKIIFADHCYACTAGHGSSCCGQIG